LQAAGFSSKRRLRGPASKERDLNAGGIRVSWRRSRAESLFDTVGLTVIAWRG
jgi:hypothetical protein